MSGIGGVHRRSNRVTANLLRAGAIGFGMIGTAGLVLATGIANADPAPEPRLVEGNVKTCEEAGLTGSILFGGGPDFPSNPDAGSGTVTDTTLDVTINAGFTASGVAVKGGTDTNVYDGPFAGPVTINGLVAPLNRGGKTPEISHWFVCGEGTPPATPSPSESPSPSPSKSPSQSPTMSPSPSPTKSPSPSPTMSPSPSPTESPAPPESPKPTASPGVPTSPPPTPDLPLTGNRTSLLVGSAVALLASGALLIAFARQRRRFEA